MRNYADLYTCIATQTEIDWSALDDVFIDGTVQLRDDLLPGTSFLRSRNEYFRIASKYFIDNRYATNCNIRLTESEEYLYARLNDGSYYVWLNKSLDYTDTRNMQRHYLFCEQIHLRWVGDKGYRIMGVQQVKEKPSDNDGDGIADIYEQSPSRAEQPTLKSAETPPTSPTEQLSNQPTTGSVNRVWVKAHWRNTNQGPNHAFK